MKKWYQSKTIRLAMLQAVLGTLIIVIESGAPAELGIVLIIKSLVDVMVRTMTDEPVKFL